MAQDLHVPAVLEATPAAPPTARSDRGWTVFAGVMFFVAAAVNTLWGLAAVVNDDLVAARELLFGEVVMWGALSLTIAAAQLVIGALILLRQDAGAVLGIMLAVVSATVALITIGVYPLWSVVVLVVDGLIIYGLSVHDTDWSS
jgi:hypothetical protein